MLDPATISDSAAGQARSSQAAATGPRGRSADRAAQGGGSTSSPLTVAARAARSGLTARAGNPLGRLVQLARHRRGGGPETVAGSSAAPAAPGAVSTAAPRQGPEPVPPLDLARARTIAHRQEVGLAAIAAANRRAAAQQTNRVSGGLSLAVLRATSGPPGGVQQRLSGRLARVGEGDRRRSLFDRPSSGRELVDRLRAQIRPGSPLAALGAGTASTLQASPSDGVVPRTAGGVFSPTRANAQRAALRPALLRNDNGSRRLLTATNPSRISGGFGLSSARRSVLDLIG